MIRLGIALEFGTDQYAGVPLAGVDFFEYGLQLARGAPEWATGLPRRHRADLHLHPLDVNLCGPEGDIEAWSQQLKHLVRDTGARALVSDLGFWYHGRRPNTWERPPAMSTPASECAARAAAIARACGVPFRVENPPIEWMPGRPSLWRYLEQASAADCVEVCLDVSHLLQFAFNVNRRAAQLPRDFPWERVTEVHVAGFVTLEYRGRRRRLDQHIADFGDDQIALVGQVLERIAGKHALDVCLEMEPRSPEAWQAAAHRLRGNLQLPSPATGQAAVLPATRYGGDRRGARPRTVRP